MVEFRGQGRWFDVCPASWRRCAGAGRQVQGQASSREETLTLWSDRCSEIPEITIVLRSSSGGFEDEGRGRELGRRAAAVG